MSILKDFYEEHNDKINELKAENEKLKALCETYRTCYQAKHSDVKCLLPKYRTTLQEIKRILILHKQELDECLYHDIHGKILDLITKAGSED